jgi:hypothetical protein
MDSELNARSLHLLRTLESSEVWHELEEAARTQGERSQRGVYEVRPTTHSNQLRVERRAGFDGGLGERRYRSTAAIPTP